MKYFDLRKIQTVIDIGTTKICVIIGKILENNSFEVLGFGCVPSHGVQKGSVVNIEQASVTIKEAMNIAEQMANLKIESAYIGISGSHISSYHSQGMALTKDNIVTKATIEEALKSANAITLNENQRILHSVPISYILDGVTHVKNPLGMYANRVEVVAHIITGMVNAVEDLVQCCTLNNISVEDIVLEPIASGSTILNEHEKELGTLLVDIGGGTSDVALYQNGTIKYTHIIPIAGNMFTQDIAVCLRTTPQCAEKLKKTYGIWPIENQPHYIETDDLHGITTHSVEASFLNDTLEARAIELIQCIKYVIAQCNSIQQIPGGIVLTGGGSLLQYLDQATEQATGLPTRIGRPHIHPNTHIEEVSHPRYATAYGLLQYATEQKQKNISHISDGPLLSRVFNRMKAWVNDVL